MKTWPEGLATLTIRWDDGSELVVNRVMVGPEDLSLAMEEGLSAIQWGATPRPVTRGHVTVDRCEMTPDSEDCFYTFKVGE